MYEHYSCQVWLYGSALLLCLMPFFVVCLLVENELLGYATRAIGAVPFMLLGADRLLLWRYGVGRPRHRRQLDLLLDESVELSDILRPHD